jgi:hypothetical protein
MLTVIGAITVSVWLANFIEWLDNPSGKGR